MRKSLLKQEYSDICKKAFDLSESDFYNYYKNVVKEHSEHNPNIIKKLEYAINKWMDWFHEIINHQKEITTSDIEITSVSLNNYRGIFSSVRTEITQSFFDEQLKALKNIASNL